MKYPPCIKFYPKERKIVFTGGCLDVIGSCKAMCCRGWDVMVTREEFLSKRYDASVGCQLDGGKKPCENGKKDCVIRLYQLNKKKDGSCVYLSNKNKCSIYKNRPEACRAFNCKKGWLLSSPCPELPENGKIISRKYHDLAASNNLRFVLNPSVELKTIFYVRDRKELVFVKKAIDICCVQTGMSDYDDPRMDEEKLLYLADLFDGKNNIGDVLKKFKAKHAFKLTKKELHDIIQIFVAQNIILYKNQG